ncbi:MAG: hypothetical protein LUH18_02080 [Oscillospiraceae bacterium]|nr:hypothetical protein [Oscillospiraceae bacterium]
MKRNHKLSKTLFAVALCAVMTTSGFAVPDTDETGTDVNTTPATTEEEIAKESIAVDAYIALIEAWSDENGDITYPDYYAGAYLNSDRVITILVTELSDEVKAELSAIIDLDEVVLKEATYSYNELLAAKDEIVEKMDPNSDDPFIAAIYGVGIYDDLNSVHVDLNIEDPEVAAIAEDAELLAATVKEKLTDFEGVYVDATYGGIMALVEDTDASEAVETETPDTDANAGIMLIDDDLDDAEEASNPATGVALALVPAAVAAAMAVVIKKRK